MVSQEDILAEFFKYYNTLYTSSLPPDFDPTVITDILDTLALGRLTDAEEATPSVRVLLLKKSQLPPRGKPSPGPDGLPITYRTASP